MEPAGSAQALVCGHHNGQNAPLVQNLAEPALQGANTRDANTVDAGYVLGRLAAEGIRPIAIIRAVEYQVDACIIDVASTVNLKLDLWSVFELVSTRWMTVSQKQAVVCHQLEARVYNNIV